MVSSFESFPNESYHNLGPASSFQTDTDKNLRSARWPGECTRWNWWKNHMMGPRVQGSCRLNGDEHLMGPEDSSTSWPVRSPRVFSLAWSRKCWSWKGSMPFLCWSSSCWTSELLDTETVGWWHSCAMLKMGPERLKSFSSVKPSP